MHISQRFLVALLGTLVLVPLAAVSALTEADDRYKQTESIRQAVEQVSEQQSAKAEHAVRIEESKRVQQVAEKKLQQITKDKRAVRLRLAEALHQEDKIKERGIENTDTVAIIQLLESEKDRLRLLLRTVHVAYVTQSTQAIGVLLGQTLVSETLGERTERAMRQQTALEVREELLGMLHDFQSLPEVITALRTEHQQTLVAYHQAQKDLDDATAQMHASAVSQEEIQRIVNEVQSQILQMQSELARIDARMRRQAERALIEKGLLAPKEGEYTSGKIVGDPAKLSWPVNGAVTAGFYDENYKHFFGVPHKAIDIRAKQGTDVYAAADGVVYLARDGGRTGYSYILIGHQGGTATLYGHLSAFSVSSGQEVYRGQVIGQSGGTPGTHGAGPMTTGAHLHFEVIQNGKHVNPISVLP